MPTTAKKQKQNKAKPEKSRILSRAVQQTHIAIVTRIILLFVQIKSDNEMTIYGNRQDYYGVSF